jgi:hypothetical protein
MRQEDMINAHRYLDGELSAGELSEFESRLKEDSSLASYVEGLWAMEEQMARSAVTVKAPEVILPTGPLPGLRDIFSRRWSVPAWSAVAAAAAVLLLFLVPGQNPQPERLAEVPVERAAGVSSNLRLVYYSPQALTVSVVGDFNAWSSEVPLIRKDGGGYWVTDLVLDPGEYQYVFIVDGDQRVVDSTADYTLEVDYGSKNSVVRVGI